RRTPDDPPPIAAPSTSGRTWFLDPTTTVLSVVLFIANLMALRSDWVVTPIPRSPAIQQACEYLLRRYPDPFSINALASAVVQSRSRLAELFRKETGQTIRQCLMRMRVGVAKYLLAN